MVQLTEDDTPWYNRGDLSEEERNAIRSYLENGEITNQYLRARKSLFSETLVSSENLDIFYLDQAIEKSQLHKNYQSYRGVSGEYGLKIMDNLLKGLTIISDPGYVSFTFDLSIAMDYANIFGVERIVFIIDCVPGEKALFIGGEESEILFPRDEKWQVFKVGQTTIWTPRITFIYLKRVICDKSNDI